MKPDRILYDFPYLNPDVDSIQTVNLKFYTQKTEIIKFYKLRALRSALKYGLQLRYQNPRIKKILEIGCGLGFFSAYLKTRGYEVTSVDGFDNHQNYMWTAIENDIKVPKTKFWYSVPNNLFELENKKQFDHLANLKPYLYDLIIWENSDFIEGPNITQDCFKNFLKNLYKLLNPSHGKIILHFSPGKREYNKEIEIFLKPYQMKEFLYFDTEEIYCEFEFSQLPTVFEH